MALYPKILLTAALVFLSALVTLCFASGSAQDNFGRTPILEGGRLKPVDTLARTALMRFGGREYAKDDASQKISASVWIQKLSSGNETQVKEIDALKIFRVDHPELKALAGDSERKFFSYAELTKILPALSAATAKISSDSHDPYDRQLLSLVKNLLYYYELKDIQSPAGLLAQNLGEVKTKDINRINYEYFFNNTHLLTWVEALYCLVFIVALLAGVWPRQGRPIAFALLTIAIILHFFGILSRMYIQERPPVTNLYSSALFIGAIAVLGTLFIERALKNNLGLLLGALIGFATLQISDKLAESGDTLEMMRAVLDSNFWLATHVVVVTIGYSAVFIAGGIGALYFIREVFLRSKSTPTELKKTANIVYGTTCAALLFSFVGTMLGGIWADQSWGRFWGWDPKENGALMIVFWTALILHARWGGIVKDRGVLVLAIGGNIITAWSWFGTNLLGVGLHSYGFTDSGLLTLQVFVLLQLALMALGALLGLKSLQKPA